MRRPLIILGLAALVLVAASLVPNSSHGLGTGSNSWDFRSFGWPVETWSRTEHVYQTVAVSPDERRVETVHYPTRYSVRWVNAGTVFAGAIVACYAFSMWMFPSKDNEHSQPEH